jgi:hypothetical protein
LVTLEAFRLYQTKTAPGGAIAVNISNRFLDLAPVMARVALELSLEAWLVDDKPRRAKNASRSTWVLMGHDIDEHSLASASSTVKRLLAEPAAPVWTDQFSNLASVMRVNPLNALSQLVR